MALFHFHITQVKRSAGQSAIASKVEMAGKVGVLTVSLPLFQRLLSVVTSLVGG